ncbi:26754_t:CDS:2, partial [Racocetra persica]
SIISIKPLTHALQKYSPSANHLTNLHQFLIKECLLTKCYRQALPILDNDITEIETSVISAPAIVTSQVQAEAYKKFSLVSLLLHGK